MLRRSIARPKETSLPLHVQDIPGRRSHGKRRKRTKGSCGNCCRHFNTSVSSVSSHRSFARQHHRGLLLPQRRGTIASYENSRRGVWVAFLLLSFAIIYLVLTSLLHTRHSFSSSHKGSSILIRREQGIYHGVIRPLSFHSIEQDDDESSSDFNDIDTDFLDRVWNRQIHSDPQDSISEVQEYDRHEDGFNFYSDVDDDGNTYLLFDHYVDEWGPKPEYKRQCQTPLYATQLYINCNSFHELDRTTVHRHNENSDFPQVVGNGESHYVFKILPPQAPRHPFVLKTIFTDTRPDTSYSHRQYEEMRKDAIVFDLFQNNNYFVDMYGYCGLSIFSEFMPHGDIDTVATPTFDAYRTNNNNWTDDQLLHMNSMEPEFKLRVALEMAESVAYLHNFEGGIIVHNDLHAVQFLFTPEGRNHWNTTNQVLKISDFNMATFMKYDMNDHEYCTYHNGIGGGDWRSPEEFQGAPLDEKIDIHALGLNIFALLTGMVPFPFDGFHTVQRRVAHGEIPTIDDRIRQRSVIEDQLAAVMDECLKVEPEERPNIVQLVNRLRRIYHDVGLQPP